MKLSIVIPVYNEEKTLHLIIDKVEASLKNLTNLETITAHEIIIVEDGSNDGTKAVIEKNYSKKENYRIYFQEVNQGKGAAIIKGFSLTTGDVVLVQDADLEYDPEDYKTLLKPILEHNADVVYGSRFKGEVVRVLYYWHYLGNKFLTLTSNAFTNLNLTDMETCYKVFKGSLIRNMILTSNRFGIEPEITAKISKIPELKIYEVPISYDGRTYAEGKKIGWKDGFSALWCIFKFNFLTGISESFKTTSNQILKEIHIENK